MNTEFVNNARLAAVALAQMVEAFENGAASDALAQVAQPPSAPQALRPIHPANAVLFSIEGMAQADLVNLISQQARAGGYRFTILNPANGRALAPR